MIGLDSLDGPPEESRVASVSVRSICEGSPIDLSKPALLEVRL